MRFSKLAFLLLACAGSIAQAATIAISPIGGGLTLQSGNLSATVFGSGEPGWSSASLASAHAALNASGVNTDGKVTIVPADTDHGLALMVLIDREFNPGSPITTGHLEMDTVGAGPSLAYINDVSDTVNISAAGGSSRIASANFTWNSNGEGDGFAWAGLLPGNTMTFRFQRLAEALGLTDPNTFQFVTWANNTWSVVPISPAQASFTTSGEYGFDANVIAIPLPTTAGLCLLPLLAAGALRRRLA